MLADRLMKYFVKKAKRVQGYEKEMLNIPKCLLIEIFTGVTVS